MSYGDCLARYAKHDRYCDAWGYITYRRRGAKLGKSDRTRTVS